MNSKACHNHNNGFAYQKDSERATNESYKTTFMNIGDSCNDSGF